jgi:hypothetical protein
MLTKLSAVFGQLKHSFQVLDLLCDSRRRDSLVKAVLNKLLTVPVPDFLHIDITYALDEVFHGSGRLTKSLSQKAWFCR